MRQNRARHRRARARAIAPLGRRPSIRAKTCPESTPSAKTRTARRRDDALLRYEQLLLDGLFRDGSPVNLSSLRTTFVSRLETVRYALYQDVVAQGWFAGRPDKVRQKWYLLGGAAVVVSLVILVALMAVTHAALLAVPLVLGSVLAGQRRRTASSPTRLDVPEPTREHAAVGGRAAA